MASAIQDWENHFNDIQKFFNDKGIELPALKDISTLLHKKGLDYSSIKYKMANGEGIADAIMGSMWSSIEEYRNQEFLGLTKSAMSFLFFLTRIFESVIPYSAQLKLIFQIVLAFLNLIFNENSDVKKLAGNVDDTVKHEIAGVIEELSISHTYVSAVFDTNSTEKNAIKVMIANVNIHTGVQIIGNLQSRIGSLISCNMDKSKAETCLLYMNLFVRVSLLRKSVLLQILTALRSVDYSPQTVAAITKVMEKDNARAKDLLSFLETPTVEKSATLFAFFDFGEQKHITSFALELNLKLQDLSSDFHNEELCIQPGADKKGEEYVISRSNWSTLWGLFKTPRQTHTNNAHFRFEFLPGSQNRFYIRSYDRKIYVRMKTDRFCDYGTEKPGEDGEWIVIRVGDEGTSYLLSPKKWPNQFIYLENWMSEYVRGLDDKRTYGSVKQCLFKLVPTTTNQTLNTASALEKRSIKKSTPFSRFDDTKLKESNSRANERNHLLVDLGNSMLKGDPLDMIQKTARVADSIVKDTCDIINDILPKK